MAKKKTVLGDHKKVGSKFIPPMMQFPNWNEISYINQILPEIIWMGLINDKYGYRSGINLSSKIATKAFELKETDKHINFTIASNFNLLSDKKKSELVHALTESYDISKYRDALLPLIALYQGFPLSFIGMSEKIWKKEELVAIMKKCVERHFNKYETPASIIQANVTYVRGSTGGLHFASHIDMPDLNSLLDDPESEKAKRAESFVRIGAMQEMMPMGVTRNLDWPKSFWNQSYKIDKCDFSWEEND
jgi:hypothetical protein